MSVRTRLAIMVILILLGCVFAAPYYRTQVAASKKGDQDSSLPTLRIQRTNVVPQTLEVTDVTANTLSVLPTESKSANRFRFSDSSELAPIPALEMPPIERFRSQSSGSRQTDVPSTSESSFEHRYSESEDALAPQRSSQAITPIAIQSKKNRAASTLPRQKLKPVSLIGEGIGAAATWGSSSGSKLGMKSQQTLKPRRMQEFDERRLENRTQDRGGLTKMQEFSSRESGRVNVAPTSTDSDSTSQSRHRIVNGDTLEQLSSKYYGSPEYARIIFEANRKSLASPAILPLGKELIIPAKPAENRPANMNAEVTLRPQRLPVNPPLSAMEDNSGWRRAKVGVSRLSGL